jgi:hypothetical protein
MFFPWRQVPSSWRSRQEPSPKNVKVATFATGWAPAEMHQGIFYGPGSQPVVLLNLWGYPWRYGKYIYWRYLLEISNCWSYLIIIFNIIIYIHMRDDQQLDICVSPKLWDTIQISDDWENNCPKSAFHFGIFPHCFRVHLPHLGPPGAKRMGLKHQTTAVTNGMFLRVDQQCLPTFCPPSWYLLFFLCWLHFGVSAQWFCRIVFEVLKHVSIPTKTVNYEPQGILFPLISHFECYSFFYNTFVWECNLFAKAWSLGLLRTCENRRCSRVPEVGVPQYLAIKLTIGKLMNSSIDHQVVSLCFPICFGQFNQTNFKRVLSHCVTTSIHSIPQGSWPNKRYRKIDFNRIFDDIC